MAFGRILIIDDEDKLRNLLHRIINLEGYVVKEAVDLKQALRILEREMIDIILCDVKLPDGNGVEFVRLVKEKFPLMEILLLTAYGNIPDGVQAIKNGAYDYIVKGDDNHKLIPLLNQAMEKAVLKRRMKDFEEKSKAKSKIEFSSIIGTSRAIKDAIGLAEKVALTSASILLLGETGTGKEVFAQSIHNASPRATKPMVALNCSAFSKELLENELFGHKEGAFTGAIKDKKGLIEEAHTGTLFLDEIGEIPLDLQAKLLRVLEDGVFMKLGTTKSTTVDVRIIAATNRHLQQLVDEGKFREDLYYRLNVFTIQLPSLNDRPEDIPLLAEYFLQVFAGKANKNILSINKDALKIIQQHNWKGNVRELKNILERACILATSTSITTQDLPTDFLASNHLTSNFVSLEELEKIHIQKILGYMDGNKTKAAEILGIGIATLYRKMQEYKLSS